MATNRYMTPIKYKNGNGITRTAKLYFELSPVELADWAIDNAFEANELAASLREMREIHEEEERDLTSDEIQTMLGVIRTLAKISAGKPSEDGEYFIKDPNWTDSYAYLAFRVFLMTHPNETNQFLTTLLDSDVMDEFNKALTKANEENADVKTPAKAPHEMSEAELRAALQERTAANVVRQQTVSDQV